MKRGITGVVVCVTVVTTAATLSAPAAANTMQDQVNSGPIVGSVRAFDGNYLAQSFVAGVSGRLERIALTGCNVANDLASVTVGIYSAVGAPPNSTPPALPTAPLASTTLTGTALAAVPDAGSGCTSSFDVVFSQPASISAGFRYTFVVSTTSTVLAPSQGLRLQSSDISTYTAGNRSGSADSGATWTAATTRNLLFATFVNDGTTPPPILQQFGKPESGTCDQAAVARGLDWSGAPSGGWGLSWAQWVNSGLGGPVCTRTLVYSTALGRWTVG